SVETVKSITRDDILMTFRKWYVPNNMTLVIAGDIDASEALAAVKREFKDFKKAAEPHGKRPVEPAQKGLRAGVLTMDVKEAHLGMAFHIPSIKDEDNFALDVLQIVLSGGQTSRLVKRIKIDDQLVHSISAYPMSLKDPGLFFITAALEAKNIERTIEETLEEIERLKARGPDFDELEKAKFNIESDFVYSRETMDGIASKLGYYETLLGDHIYEKRYVEGIRKVSAEDIKRVLDKYFTPGNTTLTALLPAADGDAITGASLRTTVTAAAEKAKTAFAGQAEQEEKTTRVVLENGMTLIVKEAHANPTVAFYAAFPGGLRFEEKDKNGIGNFTAAMLARGTQKRTREELARETEEMAGGVSGFSGWNSTGASGKFLSMHFDKGLGILADVMLNPTFPEEEIEKLREDLLAAVKRQEDNLPGYTFKLLYRELFTVHPYGMTTLGEADTISSITRENLTAHHGKFFAPGRMVLVITGDVGTEHAVEKVKELFGGFKNQAPELKEPAREPRMENVRRTGGVREKEQTHIGIGFHGAAIKDEDRYPLMVMAEVLSGQGGRLFMDLRDRQSLAYSISAFSKDGADPGIVGVYIGTAPEKKDKAVSEIFKQLERMRDEDITEAELNRAKKSLIGGYEIGLQSVSSQASDAANNELYGLGYDFYRRFPEKINAVTAADVRRAAQKYLTLDAYAISIVGSNGYEGKKEGD
ncbi:MAG: pitrilysin family protein, partial [Deltaproteobacteria bacterium]|nr:pitrilysin family protein [Deltaproteobacteria bacterium]